ncbi:MAG: hypothetical protein NZZ41_00740 [Candidatus Dojkabacteria bacterium]|nr:hypothetical protein [Candidatus Dojkabacteria bacterium]
MVYKGTQKGENEMPARNTQNIFEKILDQWKNSYSPVGRVIGCCRVYVSVNVPKDQVRLLSKACKKHNLIFQKKSYYKDINAIYIGYDNCDGIALGRAEHLVQLFRDNNIAAVMNAHGD